MTTDLRERLAGKIVCYHGTSQENVESILREGFREGSYFAYRVADSLAYGGPYLFAVAFSVDPAMWHGEENGFQFHLREAMGPEEILWHTPIVLTLLAAERERCAESLKLVPYLADTDEHQKEGHRLIEACQRTIRALPPGPDALKELITQHSNEARLDEHNRFCDTCYWIRVNSYTVPCDRRQELEALEESK